MTPVHHQGVIQQSISAENGIEGTQEYRGCHQILSVDHKLYVYDYPQMYTYSTRVTIWLPKIYTS